MHIVLCCLSIPNHLEYDSCSLETRIFFYLAMGFVMKSDHTI